MSAKDQEKVLVVPTSLFHQLGYFQGFMSHPENYVQKLLAEENISFLKRKDAENNPEFKQLIPYMLFSWTDSSTGEPHFFSYVRGKGMGEARLHSKKSVGIGGHINSFDKAEEQKRRSEYFEFQTEKNENSATAPNLSAFETSVYRLGMLRERDEEVRLGKDVRFSENCIGLINDDSNEVGKVHLGVVHRFELSASDLQANEDDLISSGFEPISRLLQETDQMESWSAIVLQSLFQK